ncbi:cytochrome P450 [Streptomyces sp. WAC00469]|uniref:cytochrome P450 n=1 Tax=Streptomyces sp. WAC00469 TaxID=2487415 RepID=UPI000F73A069|nr:cytochrome P450 [Streptomyces sp. WAC00469]RSS06733.1 cytochrome P450 [Streptomyces sp. WAC00469]
MTITDPHPFPFSEPDELRIDPRLEQVREKEPLCPVKLPHGEPGWLVTRYEDVKTVLGDPRFSRAEAVRRDEPRTRYHRGLPGNIMEFDPPEHTRLRRVVAKAFTARRVEQLRVRAQEIADRLVDEMIAQGPPADLVSAFALPLPVTVICELLGVPFEDRVRFRHWSDALLSTTRFSPEEIDRCADELSRYMAGLVAERRKHPQDDLLGVMVAARDEQDRLTEDELVAMGVGVLVAGHETTASQIPNFVHTLLEHPEELARLRVDLGLVPQAVEELMRFVPLGSASTARYAVEDVELSGGVVHAGEPVVVSTAAANRDTAVFTCPERLDLTRKEAAHVGFGHGPHHCLGAQLARMELQVALSTLLRRLPGLRLAGTEEDLVWKAGSGVRGLEKMLITWEAAA